MTGPSIPSSLQPVRHDPAAFAEARAAVDELVRALVAAGLRRDDEVATATAGWEGLLAGTFRHRLDPTVADLRADALQQLARTRDGLADGLARIEEADAWRSRRRTDLVERWHRQQRATP